MLFLIVSISKNYQTMITITYSKYNNQIDNWKQQLDELVMSYKLIEDSSISTPQLVNNQEIFNGYEAINQHVSELMVFKETWFACMCG
jgi:hypothetical protein